MRWWQQPKWRSYLVIAMSFVATVLSASMVFVLLPSIASDFGVTLRAVGWVVITESLVIAALLLPLGGLADRVGRRRFYVSGLVIFGVGSILTGLAPGFTALIVARIIMSIGNALVQSVGTGMLAAAFPANEKGLVMGAQTTAVALGAASGPLVGGFGVNIVGWRALFILLAIPVALSVIAALVVLEDDRPRSASKDRLPYDGVGGALSGVAVVVLVFTISNPFGLDLVSAPVLTGLVVFALLLSAFIRNELRHPSPMLELRLFAISAFRTAVLVRVLGFIGNTVSTLLIPIYLLSLRGFADRTAGMVIFCAAVGVAIGAQISGRLADIIGPGPPAMIGLTVQVTIMIILGFAGLDTSLWLLVPVVFASGLGLALWNVPNNSTMMASVPPANFGVVGAFTNVTRTMGNVLGQALATAIVVTIMTSRGFDVPLDEVASSAGARDAFLRGWRVAYLVVMGLGIVTLFVASRLPFSPVVAPTAGKPETTEM